MGFVDREFREFEFSPIVIDKLGNHKVEGRLIWSKGHSLENYYFHKKILNKMFDTFSSLTYRTDVKKLFSQFFDDVLRISFALSIAALPNHLKDSESLIDSGIIKGDELSIELDIEKFKQEFIKRKK